MNFNNSKIDQKKIMNGQKIKIILLRKKLIKIILIKKGNQQDIHVINAN